jgi:hypothetical protein
MYAIIRRYTMKSGTTDRELVTVGVVEDRAGVAESTRCATEFVKTLPVKDQLSSPEIL